MGAGMSVDDATWHPTKADATNASRDLCEDGEELHRVTESIGLIYLDSFSIAWPWLLHFVVCSTLLFSTVLIF